MKRIMSSLSYKLTFIVILLVGVIIVVNWVTKRQSLIEYQYERATESANNISRLMYSKIDAASHKALMSASIFAEMSSVKWAYSVYNTTNNIDSSSAIIKRNVAPYMANIKRVTKVKPKVQFHLPPAKSFLRMWTDKKGDDFGSFRKTVVKISQTHEAVRGVEVGRTGLVIRGIAPIFDNSENYLGSVEVIFPFKNMIKKITDGKTEHYALYLKKEQYEIADLLRKKNGNINNSGDKDLVLVQNSTDYNSDALTEADLNITTNEIHYKTIGNYVYALIPIFDFDGENVALASIQIDITDSVNETNSTLIKIAIVAFIILLISSFFLIVLINRIISKPISALSRNIKEISTGKLIDEIESKSNDEVGMIYKAFNVLIKRLKSSTSFANEIGKGNLDINIDDVGEDDVLSHALISMKNNLLEARNTELKRKDDEAKRNWATKGHAEFGEILRQNNDNIDKFSVSILTNLVKYTESNQGGLFILNDNDKDNLTLDLAASYAYNRQKYVNKEILMGEGLVGTCAIEMQTVFITDVPDDYVQITSGLGDANPRNILIVPLKVEDKLFGVIELASFKIYEDYKIEFIEKLAESIASSLSSTKINIVTAELLEQSQQQQEEMAAQEEEMRQNLEEMQATQEDMGNAKKEAEIAKTNLDKVPNPVISIDTDFNVTYINESGAKLAGVTVSNAINSKCYNLFKNSDCNTENCKCAMAMNSKQKEIGKTIIDANNEEIIYTGVPIIDADNNVIGAIEEIMNISEIKKHI